MKAQYGKFLDMIRAVRINIPLVDVLAGMPNYGKFLKELISNKHKIKQIYAAFLSDESSTMIQNKVLPKLGDPGSFLIPCNFNITFSCNALADLEQLNLGVGTERMIFNIDSAIKQSYSNDDTYFSIDVIDEILEEDFDALLDEGSKILHSIEGTLLEEEIFSEFDKFIAMAENENYDSESDEEEPKFKKITVNTDYKIKTSLEEPPTDLELKPFPDNLEYVFLEEPSFLLVIISSQLSAQNKSKLISVLKNIKKHLSGKQQTFLPKLESPFELMCDASDFAVGAVLGQKDGKKFHPIYFASKTLNSAQQKYTITEKELMAVVFAFDKFRSYLILSKTIDHTDYSALKNLFKKQDAKPRLIRWIPLLQEFDIEIKDKKCTENVSVDHLSRIDNNESSDDNEVDDNFPGETLMEINTRDVPCLSFLCVFVRNFHLTIPLFIMKNTNPPPTNNRPVLPTALRAQAIQELHELQKISAFVDSRLESIERFLNDFTNQPNETNTNDLKSDNESVDTPLVSPFPHLDNDSDDGEVLNELIEYENVECYAEKRQLIVSMGMTWHSSV
ncbi:reverse transcriptase domain-containing protein [Tanacetum coccineum]